jgi:HSP20 family protein
MNPLAVFNSQPTTLWDDFDVLFRDIFDNSVGFSLINQAKIHYPVDIKSHDLGVDIDIAIVGVDKKDVKIEMEDDVLHVSYKNESKDLYDTKPNYLHRGITRKAFDFAWKLSSKLDSSKIKAEMDKGILSIKIPYSAEKQKRAIEVL